MNSSTRTLEISVPIDAIKSYYEAVLHTVGILKPREELLKLEILNKAPWDSLTELPLKLTVQVMKEVGRTEVNGKESKSL